MNIWENLYVQQLNHLQLIIAEQSPQEPNLLYTLGHIPQQLATRDESQSAHAHNTGTRRDQ
jgi:hypothetical protein